MVETSSNTCVCVCVRDRECVRTPLPSLPPTVCVRARVCARVINCSATAQRWSYRNDGDDANGDGSRKKCSKTNMAAT